MNTQKTFRGRVREALNDIGSETLSYNEEEFWMIAQPYELLEYYANEKQLFNTAIALPLARGLHDGVHRKSSVVRDGTSYRLPYYIHPLLVTRMLSELNIPVSNEEEDILLASALCHDMIEDLDFPDEGRELYKVYHLDKRIYDSVKLVSKHYDWTDDEEKEFFHTIESNWIPLLIKLADRGNNVEDLYNMSVWKVHEYIGETRKFFLPMCEYGLAHYERLRLPIEILRDKIITLTEVSELFVDDFGEREKTLQAEIDVLREENRKLREEWQALWKKED